MPENLQSWLDLGVEKGWCSPAQCVSHNGLDWTEQEIADFDADLGNDPCVIGVRLWVEP
jgi:hypothetical protein